MNAFDALETWKLRLILGGICSVFVVACLWGIMAWGSHNGRLAEQKRMAPIIAGYQLRIDRLLVQLSDLEGKLKTSNDAVDQLKADADAREKAAAAALKAARTQADRYRLRASQIAAARPTGDQCVASRDLIVKTLSEERS